MRTRHLIRLTLILVCLAARPALALPEPVTVTVRDYLGWTFTHELLQEDLSLEPGALLQPGAAVSLDGAAIPSQAEALARHADGSIATLRVYWLADLAAGGAAAYRIAPGAAPAAAPDGGVTLSRADGVLTLQTHTAEGSIAISLPDGRVTAAWPRPAAAADAPIQRVLLPDGGSLGPSRIEAPFALMARETTVLQAGPLLASVELHYTFAEGDWRFRVTMIAGEALIRLDEVIDTGHSGQDGLRIDRMHVLPLHGAGFAPDRALYTGNVLKAQPYASTQKGVTPQSDLAYRWTRQNWFINPVNEAPIAALAGEEVHRLTGWPSVMARVGNLDRVQSAGATVGLVALHPERWYNPTAIRLRVDADGRPAWHFPIQRYTQSWDTDGFGDGSPNYTGLVRGVPPNAVHRSLGLVLTGPRDTATDPLLDLFALGSRHGAYSLQDLRHIPIDLPDPMAGAAWAETSTEKGAAALASMRDGVQMKRLFGHFATFSMAYHFGFARGKIGAIEGVLNAPTELSAADRAELRRLVAFYAYDMHARATFPYGNGFHLNNPNMTIMAVEARAKTALLIPDHPSFATWGEETRHILADYIPRFTKPSGAPYENPHYTLGVTLIAGFETNQLLIDAGIGDALDQPLMKDAMRFIMNWLTPADPRYHDFRVLLPVGNGSYQSVPTRFGELVIGYYAERDPELAAQLQWFANATLNPAFKATTPLQVVPESKPPQLGSAVYDQYGAFFRHGFGTPYETLFHILAGSCDGHNEWETDQLSYTLYAKGKPIHLDFGNGYFPMFGRPWLRNRVSWDMKIESSERNPSGIDQQYLSEQADYIRAYREVDQLWDVKNEYPPLDDKRRWLPEESENRAPPRQLIDIPKVTWYRQVLFLKDVDPKGPNYFVLRENFDGRSTKPTELNLWFLATEMAKQGDSFHFTGQQGVDMDVYVHTPQTFTPHTDRYGHQNEPYGRLTGDDLTAYPNGKRWEEQLLLRVNQPPGQGYLVVLYPRLAEGDPAATYRRLAPNVVEVSTPLSTDTIFMDAWPFTYEGDGLRFHGQALVRRLYKDGREAIINLAGPATLEVGDGKTTFERPGRVVDGQQTD